jgi:dTDP-4-amino-4,6-dideoxygalactose transaminase
MKARRLDVWPPLPLDVYARRPSSQLPFPLGEQSCALFKRGRHALWQGVRALGLESGDEVLMPAYHHGSEVEALVRLGLVCRFYEAGETLVPNGGELEDLLGPRTRALYLIHYLGFPQDVARWRRWCDERGLYLLEDAAQAWLASLAGEPVGSFGDLAIFCLYKSFGLPDGGAVLCTALAASTNGSNGVGLPGLARRHLASLMQHSPWLTEVGSRLERYEPYSAEVDFALTNPSSRPSAATVFLLPRVADRGAAACRRFNYQLLLEKLGHLVPPPFTDLPNGAAPFGFPVTTDDKEELLARLVREGVHALDFWREPHSALPANAFPGAASLRERVVVLPVHQELREPDVEHIVGAVRRAV